MEVLVTAQPPAAARSSSSSNGGFVRFEDDEAPAAFELTELQRLKTEDPTSALRIERLELSPGEWDVLALSVRKMNDLDRWADTYSTRNSRLFAIQVGCSALVPVLIALQGSFAGGELLLRLLAMAFSILGTACRAVEDAYDWRSQATIRRRFLTRLRALLDNFCVLSGELFDPGQTGANAKSYVKPEKRSRATPMINGVFASQPFDGGKDAALARRRLPLVSDEVSAQKPPSPEHPQAQLAAALDELRHQHSGANFRKYVVAFSAIEDECSAALTALHDRHRAA